MTTVIHNTLICFFQAVASTHLSSANTLIYSVYAVANCNTIEVQIYVEVNSK